MSSLCTSQDKTEECTKEEKIRQTNISKKKMKKLPTRPRYWYSWISALSNKSAEEEIDIDSLWLMSSVIALTFFS